MGARICFWLTAAAFGVTLIAAYVLYPERTPLHWGADGKPDRWGSRLEAVLTVGGIGAGLIVLFALLAIWAPRIPKELINLPRRSKQWWTKTPEREAEFRRRFGVDAYVVGAMTVGFLSIVTVVTIVSARTGNDLQVVAIVATGIYVLAVLAWCIYLVRVRYAPEDRSGRGSGRGENRRRSTGRSDGHAGRR